MREMHSFLTNTLNADSDHLPRITKKANDSRRDEAQSDKSSNGPNSTISGLLCRVTLQLFRLINRF